MHDYLNACTTSHMTKRRGSAPERHTLWPRACAVCSPSPCPPCSAGQMCQQVFRNKVDCTSCPSNICVSDPNYVASSGGGKAGPIGGAVGGVAGALALAWVLFWFYRAKKRREEQEATRRRVDAKLRAAEAEKFRPGGSKSNSITSLSKRTHTPGSPYFDSQGDDDDAEGEEEDIEWTEMRPDGLTTFKQPPGGEEKLHEEAYLDVAGNTKRRSTGAATHLSRITEGAEEEEEQRRRASIMSKMSGMPTQRNYGSTSSINLSLTGTLNPFSDSASVSTESSGRTKIIPIMFSGSRDAQGRPILAATPAQPERALRAAGAPLIDLQGQPAQRHLTPGGSGSMLRHSNGSVAKANNYLPASQSPLRTQRDPTELAYRGSSTLSALSPNDGQHARYLTDDLSPAAPSTSASQHFDFRNMDPEEIAKLPEELRRSAVYARAAAAADGRPLSGQTMSSQFSSSTDYAPQLVTPQSGRGEAPKRIVVSTAKASLVRSLSQKHRDAAGATATGGERASSRFSAVNPFSDDSTPHSSPGDEPYATPHYGDGLSINSSSLTVHTYGDTVQRPGSADTTGTFGEPGRVNAHLSMPRSAMGDSLHGLRTGGSLTTGSEWTQPSAPAGHPSSMMRPESSASGLSVGALPFTESSLAYAAHGDRASYWTDSSRDSSIQQTRASTRNSNALGTRPASGAASSARQSNACSIGGLSVFDDIPFDVSSNPLPSNAAASIAAAQRQQEQHQLHQRSTSDWLDDEDTMASDEEWHVEDSAVAVPPRSHGSGADVLSLPPGDNSSRSEQSHRIKPSSAPSARGKPVATGATTDFEALRLQHELAQYPFATYSPTATDSYDQPGSPRD